MNQATRIVTRHCLAATTSRSFVTTASRAPKFANIHHANTAHTIAVPMSIITAPQPAVGLVPLIFMTSFVVANSVSHLEQAPQQHQPQHTQLKQAMESVFEKDDALPCSDEYNLYLASSSDDELSGNVHTIKQAGRDSLVAQCAFSQSTIADRSRLYVPVMNNNTTLAVLEFYHEYDSHFTREDEKMAQRMAESMSDHMRR